MKFIEMHDKSRLVSAKCCCQATPSTPRDSGEKRPKLEVSVAKCFPFTANVQARRILIQPKRRHGRAIFKMIIRFT